MAREYKIWCAAIAIGFMSAACRAAECHSKYGVVYLNCVRVLELMSPSNGAELATRASELAKELRQFTGDDQVSVKMVGETGVITIGSQSPIKVTSGEAAYHHETVSKLANEWADAIRDALNLPSLKFPDDFYRLPVGTTKTISLVGSLAYGAIITSTNPTVAAVTKTDEGVVVKCVGVGDAAVRAESENSLRVLPIYVRPYAANFPQSLTVEVAGDPAGGDTIASAIDGAIKGRLTKLPTATITFTAPSVASLGEGKSSSYSVHVRARAVESFDGVGLVTITVRNVTIPIKEDASLWYSNTPEKIERTGCLFAASLKPQTPVRLLYHHINATSLPLLFRAEAVNDSDQAARLAIRPADSKPELNPVKAGVQVAQEFFKNYLRASSEIVTIPPRSSMPISFHRLSPNETVSGLCSLRLLDGPSDLLVRVDALPSFDLDPHWNDATFSSTPWHDAGVNPINDYDRASYEPSDHIYPNPYRQEEAEYEVGGRFASALFGQKPIPGQDHSSNLDGNYGVLYSIKFTLRNSTSAPADVEMVYESSAGYTAGVFVLDGEVVQTPYLGSKGQARIAKYHLLPGSSRAVQILTLPVSGGSYPATLIVRPVQ